MALSTTTAAARLAVEIDQEDLPPEILAAIAAAVTAYLGANHRILSARISHSPDQSVSQWTRQARASVQASHNLRSKR